ncbi:uncharacterized protein A1O9_10454 [Exophiala aquamarina CBS 119918]|uniref:Ribosome biogenesis protein Alb1 n=1 Tax=Exophiala aquamarina CBS 119918 TaxID=1182545 RepID=A0A072P035_9EURO|nr:uncharacterized protein A1O9_10454 [Exophiala aquamarina CBS 119918]KEF53479.1 hypothetical protein A1O9_10454 [Exophiala aquamarina CBS 119918]
MAKTAKPKKNPLANPRSRASKRASSPSIDTDKSLKHAPRVSDTTTVLAAKPYGGVTKAKKKHKQLTRGQKKRHEKGLARAEVVQDQLAKKADVSQMRLKKIRERKSLWDETNGAATAFDRAKRILNQGANEMNSDGWEDEDMEQSETKVVDGVKLPAFAPATKLVIVNRTASSNNTDAEDDINNIT